MYVCMYVESFYWLNYGPCVILCASFSLFESGENVADDGGGGGRLQSTEYFHKTGKVQK